MSIAALVLTLARRRQGLETRLRIRERGRDESRRRVRKWMTSSSYDSTVLVIEQMRLFSERPPLPTPLCYGLRLPTRETVLLLDHVDASQWPPCPACQPQAHQSWSGNNQTRREQTRPAIFGAQCIDGETRRKDEQQHVLDSAHGHVRVEQGQPQRAPPRDGDGERRPRRVVQQLCQPRDMGRVRRERRRRSDQDQRKSRSQCSVRLPSVQCLVQVQAGRRGSGQAGRQAPRTNGAGLLGCLDSLQACTARVST